MAFRRLTTELGQFPGKGCEVLISALSLRTDKAPIAELQSAMDLGTDRTLKTSAQDGFNRWRFHFDVWLLDVCNAVICTRSLH